LYISLSKHQVFLNVLNAFSSFDRSRPSPVKSEPIEKLITRVQIAPDNNKKESSSSKKYLNESLTNLRQDLRFNILYTKAIPNKH
jgi:hypothetical protein